MGRFDRFTRITDPVDAVARVVSVTLPPDGHGSAACEMNLVIEMDGAPAVPVRVTKIVKMRLWPQAGQTLPVTVSRTDPSRLKIRWDEVPTGSDRAAEQARNMADAMNRGATPTENSPSDPAAMAGWTSMTVNGVPVDDAGGDIADMIRAALGGAGGIGNMETPAAPAGDATGTDERLAALEQLAALRDAGALTEEEFAREKERLLGG